MRERCFVVVAAWFLLCACQSDSGGDGWVNQRCERGPAGNLICPGDEPSEMTGNAPSDPGAPSDGTPLPPRENPTEEADDAGGAGGAGGEERLPGDDDVPPAPREPEQPSANMNAEPARLVVLSDPVVIGMGRTNTAMITPYDLDRDGLMDLVVGNGRLQGMEQNIYLLNLGDRQFAEPVAFGQAGKTYAVRVSDFDGDGSPDIAVANTAPNASAVSFDDGTLSFSSRVPLNNGMENTRNLVVGDLNNDGLGDLVVANRAGQNWVGLSDGQGRFERINFGTGRDQSVGLSVADFDGDGAVDIVVANRTPDVTRVYQGDGTGVFSTDRAIDIGEGREDIRWLEVGDIDGNGYPDLVTVEFNGPDRIYLQSAPMKFAARADIILGGNNTASYTVNTADVDGNGLLDVLVGRRGQPNVAYLQGPGLDFSLEMPFGTGRDNTYSVGGADLDGDGDIDLYVGNAGEPNAIYFQE